MNTKTISYVVALVGLIVLGLGVYWDLVKHDHPTRGLVCLIAGAVLLIAGLVGAFVMKPKASVA
jgi:sulfite exporter TauE/SafE